MLNEIFELDFKLINEVIEKFYGGILTVLPKYIGMKTLLIIGLLFIVSFLYCMTKDIIWGWWFGWTNQK